MPPSSNRRTRTRKLPEQQEKSDVDDMDEISTPTRKRRRINHQEAGPSPLNPRVSNPRNAGPNSRAKTRSSDVRATEEDSSFNEDDVDTVIRNLGKARYEIAARNDYANEVHEMRHPEGRTAFAKIAGNGWTFYVDDVEIRIGRPPDERQFEDQNERQNADPSTDKSLVHIDLGPSKLVSRQHAEIRFNEENGRWVLRVNGRNGARLDDESINKGNAAELRSGSVLEIAGTQMMFVMPNEAPEVHPKILHQIRSQREDNEDDDDDDDADLMQPPSLPHRTPTKTDGNRLGPPDKPSSSYAPSSSHHQPRGNYTNPANLANAFSQNDGSADSRIPSSQAEHKSPSYSRGLMLETTEDIDYSVDSAKDIKPPHSYAQLIAMAILSDPEEKLTLAKIYDWIKERYAFYRHSGGGWQNSIRHNLSLNKCFEKVARRTDEPGKGMKWQIVAEHRDEFFKKSLNQGRRTLGRGSSAPNSPSREGLSSTDGMQRLGEKSLSREVQSFSKETQNGYPKGSKPWKDSPNSTPPMSNYPVAKQTFTPEQRPSSLANLRNLPDASSPVKGLGTGVSPFPFSAKNADRFGALTETAAAGSPGGPRISLGGDSSEHFYTPLISKHVPRLAPPSTARMPSQFMPMSSPAPFWKYADYPSLNTPGVAKFGLESSPVKGAGKFGTGNDDGRSVQDARGANEDFAGFKSRGMHSSSPPLPDAAIGAESPTKAIGNRAAEKTSSQPLEPSRTQANFVSQHSNGLGKGQLGKGATGALPRTSTQGPEDDDEEDEEEEGGMIDLARGFQPIGSFHRNMNAGPGIVGRN